ncbi:cadherin-like and PC-esterase domain-containing protein 1 [Daphnia pulex]|uniref:cadherin-like and PC-esterase domain-containing protein 1 n=1 Tax=Daphnia pulex TaxID=6669 RepID=UPI001EE0BFC1|nr:cadherin-like and PC-esterase domain-containing protein 1 [Daphnia pulex]XP_046439707.1 cadherin-like and PC-esterase domain-containing protein 1 [Daphnia pulex]
MKRCYSLFLGLTVSSLFTIILVARREAQQFNGKFIRDEDDVKFCEWKMMHNPAMQSSNHDRWNVSLLLSLGLLAPKTSYGLNGSLFTVYRQKKQSCREYEDQTISQLVLRRILKELSSYANSFCLALRNVTGRMESCYDLDNHLDEFLTNDFSLNKSWRCFHPPETTSRTMTTLQIYQALRIKRFSGKQTMIVPMSDDNAIRFKNATFIIRFFFLIESINPVKVYVFQNGMLLLDEENWLHSFEEFGRSFFDKSVYDSAVRWIRLLVAHVEKLFPVVDEFKRVISRDKVSQILAADFMPKSSGLELFRMHDSVQRLRSKSTPHSLQLLLHKTISTAVNYLSFRHSHSTVNEIGPVLNEDLYGPEEIFGLITNLIITPSTKLEPAFQPRWTHYTATVPYETTLLNLKVVLNGLAAYALFESERSNHFEISIGLDWNDFKIEIGNKDPQIRPIIYILRIRRLTREDNPLPFHANHQTVCILEQECSLRFKEKPECGLQASPFGNWSSALTDWNRLPTCPFGNSEEGAWMIPCSSCLLERSCYWSRARWQPFVCRHPHYSPSELQQCLLHRKLIFVGDSTNRGMMESLLERLDGWLTTSDRTKWHGYRHRLANIGGQTQFDFDYYPKFWMSSRTSLQQTLTHMLRRAEANESDTTLVVGGLDWMSVEHLDTIRQVLDTEGLSGMAVVIKMAGAGLFHSDVTWALSRREKELVSTARRLARLSQTARLHYGFRTVDTWNMTAARFRDFLPGRCRCHFHQITEADGGPWADDADAVDLAQQPRSHQPPRFRIEGPINQVYTEILADQICRGR